MIYRKYLPLEAFYKTYRTEIDRLFTVTLGSLETRGVRIYNRQDFYRDFVKYIYKYSYKYE